MAARSNRSPSPLSSRPMNPNPRNPESIPTIRRSFSGHNPSAKPSLLTNPRRLDPTTPANSPSDFAARRSVGREGIIASHLKDCEEKENDERENVLRASKLQSPAKGCKNFMAPTISAASKFTPSPRKKALVERNDPVRTSISFSDGKAIFFSDVSHDSEPKSELDSEPKIKKAAAESHPVSKPCKKVTFSEIPSESRLSDESVVTDSDSLNLESKVLPPSSPIAPLDADPSLPPYDPKTNYLSPRPQFIRYKPNPRVEMLKALDPYEFEDGLMEEMMSEGLIDSDEVSDESQEEAEEVVTAASSADMVIGMDEEIVEEVVARAPEPRSEALPVSTTTPVAEISEEESVVEKREKKARRGLLSRFMCFSMVLLLLVACASVSLRLVPPHSFDQLSIKDLSFVELSKVYEQSRAAVASARLSFDGVARHVHHVSVKSASLVLKLVNEVVEGGEKQVPLKFMNLSDLQENSWREEGYFLRGVENIEEGEFEEDLDAEIEYEFEEDEYAEEEEAAVDNAETDAFEEEDEYAYEEEADSDEFDVVATEETVELDHSEPESAADAAAESHNQETHRVEEEAAAMEAEKSEALLINVGAADNADAVLPSDGTSFDMPMAEATPARVSSLAVALPSLLAVVLGAAAFVYRYKRSPGSSSKNVEIEPMMMSKQRDNAKAELIHQEKEISERWETESEMSSSYQSQSRRNYANEVESSERKTRKYSRRESLASSSGFSGGSPSYGSFTTYERIPVKINGYGEDEIITPVRRSSRIRNQVTSP